MKTPSGSKVRFSSRWMRSSGGHATLFRARTKPGGAFAPLAPPLDRIHRELKRTFDPDGVFNPGRLYPDL